MKKSPYLPIVDSERLTWLINLNSKLTTGGLAATLGITAAQLAIILNGIKMYTFILACITASETFYHTCISFKDQMNESIIGTIPQPIPAYVSPVNAPIVLVPFGFFGWIMALVANIKTNAAYTTQIGTDLKIIGSDIVIDWSTAQPTKVKVASNAGAIHGSFLKGEATGGRVDSRRGTEVAFTTLTNVTGSKFIDDRPNLVPGVPETRQYRIWYLLNNVVVGLVSVIVTITVNE